MNVLNNYNSIFEFPNKKTIATIGTFDGVHLGHKRILEKIISNAKKANCESVVVTFYPHPRMVLQNGNPFKLLNTIEEKKVLLEKIGIERRGLGTRFGHGVGGVGRTHTDRHAALRRAWRL